MNGERDDAFFLKALSHCIITFILALHYGTLFLFFDIFFVCLKTVSGRLFRTKRGKGERNEHQINNYFNIHFVRPLVQIKLFVRSTYLFKTLNIEHRIALSKPFNVNIHQHPTFHIHLKFFFFVFFLFLCDICVTFYSLHSIDTKTIFSFLI